MSLPFNPDSCLVLSAVEYLGSHPGRGRPVRLPHLGLAFYGLTDCLCGGLPWQVVLPIQEHGLPYMLKESCPYPGQEAALAGMAQSGLDRPMLDVEEAAPFYQFGGRNLWHWVCESLPKLLALESAGYTGKYLIPEGSKVAEESLAFLGIAQERLIPATALYRVKRLMLPPRLSGFDLASNPPLTELLRSRVLAAVGGLPGTKRCHIKRVKRRKVLNEDELQLVLQDFGFETMIPETLPLAEQFRHMTNAECSVMAHGANSTLTLLQKPCSTAIEFFSNRYVSYNNLHAARLLKLRYHALVEDLDPSCAPTDAVSAAEYLQGGLEADITVDTLHLRILLESALEK